MFLGIYCRISRLKEENKDRSIPNQKKLGLALARELKANHEFYVDEGLSGTLDEIEDRPAFDRLLKDIAIGKITHVFAYDQSRLERNPKMRWAILKIFKDNNIKYYTHIDRWIDFNNPQTELLGDILSLFNKYEVTKTSLKVKSILRDRVESGKAHGIVPYGYKKDKNGSLVVSKEEAKIVKRIYDLSLKGVGTRTIANTLNTEGVPTRYNIIGTGTISTKNKYTQAITTKDKNQIKWAGNTIRNIIVNSIYKGERIYNNEIIEVPSIFDKSYWAKVNNHLSANANNKGKKVVHRYLLKGLIRCAKCNRNMYGRTRESKKDNYYMCSSKRIEGENCGNRSINIDKIENFIWEQLFTKKDFITKIEAEFKTNKSQLQILKDAIDKENKILRTLSNEKQRAIELLIREFKDDTDLKLLIKKQEAKIKEAKLRLKDLEVKLSNIHDGENLVKKFKDNFVEYTNISSFSQKQNIINEYIENITIDFINDHYFDVTIEYKGGLGNENWKTPDQRANNFYQMRTDKAGNKSIVVSSPREIKNPEDIFNLNRFLKTTGDFHLIKSKK